MEIILLIGFIALLITGVVVIVVLKKRNGISETEDNSEPSSPDPTCCGAHDVCELDHIKVNPEIIEYFDDENLDNYKFIGEKEYNDQQIDEFREVLYTLQKKEINSWIISLSRRNINLPAILQDEARQLIAE